PVRLGLDLARGDAGASRHVQRPGRSPRSRGAVGVARPFCANATPGTTNTRDTAPAMSQENLETWRRARDAFNRGDKAAWLAEHDPDVVMIPAREWPENAPIRGPEAIWD